MFFKKFGYGILISCALFLSYPSFAENVIVEKNPQEFQSPVPSPISSYIDEIDKTNKSIKQDLLLLRNQVDTLSKELNHTKENQSDSELKKTIESQWFLLIIAFIILLVTLIIIIYSMYQKMKKDNEKSIYLKLNELSEETKKEVIKNLKIQEAEYNVEVQTISQIKQEEFETKLNQNYVDYIDKLKEEQDLQFKSFEKESDDLVTKNINSIESKLTDIFNQKDKEFLDKINEKFPSKSTEEMITKIIENNNVISSVTEKIENNVLDSINKKIEELNDKLVNKENEILTDIQKAQLANNHFNIGNIYLKDNRIEEAIEEFHLALRTDHNFYGAYINLGKAYEMSNNPDNAIDMYNQAISIRPEHYKAYFNLGTLLNSVKKYDDADFMFKRALELNPTNPKIYNNLGITNQLMNKLSIARDNYLKAIDLNKNYSDAYINLAKLETLMGNERGIYQIAENYLKKNNASEETFYMVKDLAYSTMSS